MSHPRQADTSSNSYESVLSRLRALRDAKHQPIPDKTDSLLNQGHRVRKMRASIVMPDLVRDSAETLAKRRISDGVALFIWVVLPTIVLIAIIWTFGLRAPLTPAPQPDPFQLRFYYPVQPNLLEIPEDIALTTATTSLARAGYNTNAWAPLAIQNAYAAPVYHPSTFQYQNRNNGYFVFCDKNNHYQRMTVKLQLVGNNLNVFVPPLPRSQGRAKTP